MELALRARRAREVCRVPKRYAAADLNALGDVPEKYSHHARRLAGLLEKPAMMVLFGEVGTGKTHVACGLIHAFCDAGLSARYCCAGDFFTAIKSSFSPAAKVTAAEVEASFRRAALLVVDEIDVCGETQWEDIVLTSMLGARYNAVLATVLISNRSLPEVRDRLGPRLCDRIRDGGGALEFDWKSLRGRATA